MKSDRNALLEETENEEDKSPTKQDDLTCGDFWKKSYLCLLTPTIVLINQIKKLRTDKYGKDRMEEGSPCVKVGGIVLMLPVFGIGLVNMVLGVTGATIAAGFFPCVKKCSKKNVAETPDAKVENALPAP